MQSQTPQPTEAELYFGLFVVVLALIYFPIVIWKFDWIRHYLWWGQGNWSFPASKIGAFLGGALSLTMGLMAANDYAKVIPQSLLLGIFLFEFASAAPIAIYDYRKFRNARQSKSGPTDS